jgi:hypothetical protein
MNVSHGIDDTSSDRNANNTSTASNPSSSPPSTPPSNDPVDATPLDDHNPTTSSSPDRRSEIDEQPIIISNEFLPAVLAMLEALAPRRVKVYELRGEVWVDLGTGFCQGFVENVLLPPIAFLHAMQNIASLRVTSEETPTTELLNCSIMERTDYVKQQGSTSSSPQLNSQDTLIVWTIRQTTDMALSFQEGQGCSEIMYIRLTTIS